MASRFLRIESPVESCSFILVSTMVIPTSYPVSQFVPPLAAVLTILKPLHNYQTQ